MKLSFSKFAAATIAVATLHAPAFAQSPTPMGEAMPPLGPNAAIVMTAGAVMVVRPGTPAVRLEKEMVLPNGSRVFPDGRVVQSSGVSRQLGNNQMYTMDGQFVVAPPDVLTAGVQRTGSSGAVMTGTTPGGTRERRRDPVTGGFIEGDNSGGVVPGTTGPTQTGAGNRNDGKGAVGTAGSSAGGAAAGGSTGSASGGSGSGASGTGAGGSAGGSGSGGTGGSGGSGGTSGGGSGGTSGGTSGGGTTGGGGGSGGSAGGGAGGGSTGGGGGM